MPGYISGLTYTARGRTAAITYGNGVVSTFNYSQSRGWLNVLSTRCRTPAAMLWP